MVDGVHFGEQTCLVVLAIDITGSSTGWQSWRAPRRTPPWCVNCWLASVNAVWTGGVMYLKGPKPMDHCVFLARKDG